MLHSTNSRTLESASQESGQGSQDQLKAELLKTTCNIWILFIALRETCQHKPPTKTRN